MLKRRTRNYWPHKKRTNQSYDYNDKTKKIIVKKYLYDILFGTNWKEECSWNKESNNKVEKYNVIFHRSPKFWSIKRSCIYATKR